MKTYSTSVILIQINMKTMLRYHFCSIVAGKPKEFNTFVLLRLGKLGEKMGTSYISCRNANWQLYGGKVDTIE